MKKLILGLCLVASTAYGQDYLYSGRSHSGSRLYFSQGASGEYSQQEAVVDHRDSSERWKGYAVKNSFGLEYHRFVDFGLTHSLITSKNMDNSWESLRGSRVTADLGLVFGSPVGNLRFGGGLVGSRLDYQNSPISGSVYGSGTYYSIGLNYFITPRFSAYADYQEYRERLTGDADFNQALVVTRAADLGFTLWFGWL